MAVGEHVRLDGYGEMLRILARTTEAPDGPAASYRGQAWVAGLTAGLTVGPAARPVPLSE